MNLTRKELASVKAGSNINPQSLISMVDEITSLRIDRDRIGIQRLAIEIDGGPDCQCPVGVAKAALEEGE